MKKIFKKLLLIPLTLMTVLALTACGEEAPEENNNVATDTTESFSFTYNNTKLVPGEEAQAAIKAIGETYEYFESPSCAYVGMDRCYTFPDFTVYTYEDAEGVEHILQIVLTTDIVSTEEGISIGDTSDKVLSVYSTDHLDSNGSYAFSKGKTNLCFITKGTEVTSIQYILKEN